METSAFVFMSNKSDLSSEIPFSILTNEPIFAYLWVLKYMPVSRFMVILFLYVIFENRSVVLVEKATLVMYVPSIVGV